MTKLEENNIEAQVSLMKDIIQNYKSITYSVTESGSKLSELFRKRKFNEVDNTVIFSRDDYDKMIEICYNLGDERKHIDLGILAKSAVPDNEIKLKILNLLQK